MQVINVKTDGGWDDPVPVSIFRPHFDIGDRVWLVYIRDMVGSYHYYVGEVTIAAVRRHRSYVNGKYGMLWQYKHSYLVVNAKGNNLLAEYDVWVSHSQVFATKESAITNMRSVVLDELEKDRKRHARYLAVTEDTIRRVKDETIELTYAGVE